MDFLPCFSAENNPHFSDLATQAVQGISFSRSQEAGSSPIYAAEAESLEQSLNECQEMAQALTALIILLGQQEATMSPEPPRQSKDKLRCRHRV